MHHIYVAMNTNESDWTFGASVADNRSTKLEFDASIFGVRPSTSTKHVVIMTRR